MAAILVPTMNRSEYVIRLLHFYAKQKYQDTILVGDASNEIHSENTLSVIDSLNGKLKIVYKHLPGMNIQCTKKELMKDVKETYVTYAGDDDFILPNSIQQAENFLDCNPDYSTCHGKPFLFLMDQKNEISGQIKVVSPYRLLDSLFENPLDRIYHFLIQYWVSIFSVHRSEEFRDDLNDMDKIPLETFREITLSSLSIIQGKSKRLDNLYLMRQIHKHRYSSPPLMDLMFKPSWQPSFMAFHDLLVESLIKHEKVTPEIASETVKKGFLILFSKWLRKISPKKKKFSASLVEFINNNLPFFYKLLKQTKLIILGVFQIDSLPGLLNKSSPHHTEFMVVHKFLDEYQSKKN